MPTTIFRNSSAIPIAGPKTYRFPKGIEGPKENAPLDQGHDHGPTEPHYESIVGWKKEEKKH
jgi:hypothetical protein